jgi:hypothetical protein
MQENRPLDVLCLAAGLHQRAHVVPVHRADAAVPGPAGHPFDLCLAESNPGTTIMGVMLDCPDSHALAGFWSKLLGDPVTYDADGMAMLGGEKAVLFQQVEGYNPPAWPDPARPQQLHLDLWVQDLDAAEMAALELGATRLRGGGETFRVFADPAGHPFCLIG